jgi:hypothetical protein
MHRVWVRPARRSEQPDPTARKWAELPVRACRNGYGSREHLRAALLSS